MLESMIQLPNSDKGCCKDGEDSQVCNSRKRIGFSRDIVAAEDECIGNHVEYKKCADRDKVEKYWEISEEGYHGSTYTCGQKIYTHDEYYNIT